MENSNKTSLGNLVELLNTIKNSQSVKDKDIPLKYVIYARRSTQDKERQERSLPDQIAECQDKADALGLNVIKIISEKQSAKEPGLRDKFRKMLDSIQSGKYDGIIAWAPDRLSRNMREAGEIIDLLDKNIIKDLVFPTFSFEPTANGKMLLGLAFVLSKQYSDKLSQDVRRGIRKSIEEGKYLADFKHGYYKDRNMYLRPDGRNFKLMQTAWSMRINKQYTLDEIADYLNSKNYKRADWTGKKNFKLKHKIYNMTDKVLSDLFRDPFYCGALNYGQVDVVNLEDVYDFVPTVSVEDFLEVNKLKDIHAMFKSKYRAISKVTKAKFLNGLVICSACGKPKSSGLTSKKLKNGTVRNYYYYRCETDKCKLQNKSTRAKVITEYIYDFLNAHPFTDKSVHSHYVREMKKVQKERSKNIESDIKSIQQMIISTTKRMGDVKSYLLNETDDEVKNSFKKDLKEYRKNIKELNVELNKLKIEKQNQKSIILSFQDFLELFSKAPMTIRNTKSLKKKETLIKLIFSNFEVDQRKVMSHMLNEPFASLFKIQYPKKLTNGRVNETDCELFLDFVAFTIQLKEMEEEIIQYGIETSSLQDSPIDFVI